MFRFTECFDTQFALVGRILAGDGIDGGVFRSRMQMSDLRTTVPWMQVG